MKTLNDRPHFSPEFSVGITQVDQEHHKLFEIAARVYDDLGASTEVATADLPGAIAELLDYTATHFASEEALMETAGYPDLLAHKALHQHLLSRARDMAMRAELEQQYVPIELNHFTVQWLTEHILVSDKNFGEFMAART